MAGKTAKPSLKPQLAIMSCASVYLLPHQAPSASWQGLGSAAPLQSIFTAFWLALQVLSSTWSAPHYLFSWHRAVQGERVPKTDTRVGLLQLSTKSLHQVAVVLLVTHSKQRSEKRLFPPSTVTFQCTHFEGSILANKKPNSNTRSAM